MTNTKEVSTGYYNDIQMQTLQRLSEIWQSDPRLFWGESNG